jgi:hypothetical protein
MMHLHWPHWASQVVSDVEHQGELQILALVLVLWMLVGAFLLALFTLVFGIFQHLH